MAVIGFKTVLPQEVSSLNPNVGDLYLNADGTLGLLYDDSDDDIKRATVQGIRERLLLFKGDYFLNLKEGIPYFSEIMVKNPSFANIKSYLRAAILDYPTVTNVLQIDLSLNAATRVLSIDLKIQINTKQIITSEDFGGLTLKADFDASQEQ